MPQETYSDTVTTGTSETSYIPLTTPYPVSWNYKAAISSTNIPRPRTCQPLYRHQVDLDGPRGLALVISPRLPNQCSGKSKAEGGHQPADLVLTPSVCWASLQGGRHRRKSPYQRQKAQNKVCVCVGGGAHRILCFWRRDLVSLEGAEEMVRLRRVLYLLFKIRMWQLTSILSRVGHAGRAHGNVSGNGAAQGPLSPWDPWEVAGGARHSLGLRESRLAWSTCERPLAGRGSWMPPCRSKGELSPSQTSHDMQLPSDHVNP